MIEEDGEENCQKLDPASFSSLVQKEKEGANGRVTTDEHTSELSYQLMNILTHLCGTTATPRHNSLAQNALVLGQQKIIF